MTDQLNQINILKNENSANLIKTIRFPRHHGMITERMPASKYSPDKLKKPSTAVARKSSV